MSLAQEAIEKIATREDRSLAICFFLFFSRFEYALKRAGFARKRRNDSEAVDAQADWTSYAHHLAAKCRQPLFVSGDPRFLDAVNLLRKRPPKKQTFGSRGLGWQTDAHAGDFDLQRLFVLVCRIRNNLFHGGKFQDGVEDDVLRDEDLLRAGLSVMSSCLDIDDDMKRWFLDFLEGTGVEQ